MLNDLLKKEFKPAKSTDPALKGETLENYHKMLGNSWDVINEHHLEKKFEFKNFQTALDFINKVGEYSESVNHHPDLTLGWGYASVKIFTHAISGLHERDFVYAANVEKLFQSQ